MKIKKRKTQSPRRWSELEADYVRDNCKKMRVKDLAQKLNRSERSVALFMHRHKLTKSAAHKRNWFSGTRIHRIWKGMRQRCTKPSHKDYRNYGGRGIRICAEWSSFLNFFDWAMISGYQPHLTIDRIQNDGNYEPSNCRWLTNLEQQKNRQRPPSSRFTGVYLSGTKWRASIKINGRTLHLGTFTNEVEGGRVYDRAIIENNLDRPLNFKSHPKNKAA